LITDAELTALRISLQSAALGTFLAFPIAGLIALTLVRTRIRWKFLLDTLVSIPLVMPPIITGYFLLILLGKNGPLGSMLDKTFGVEIIFTWIAAALAAGLIALPLMVRAIEVALAEMDPRMELVARSLGASRLYAFWTITLPLCKKGLIASILLGFARGLGEFGATLIIAGNIPGRTQTLPLAMFTELQAGDDNSVIRLVLLSLILTFLTLLIHHVLIRKRKTEAK
jgi:molybdate transport system permease protein